MQATSTFWAATHLLPRAELATIPQMKEETQGFRIIPNIQIFISEIALFYTCLPLNLGALVQSGAVTCSLLLPGSHQIKSLENPF